MQLERFFMFNVITDLCLTSANGGLAKLLLKLGHELIIISHHFIRICFLIRILISMTV